MASVLKGGELIAKLAEPNIDFALDMYKHLPDMEQGGNIFFSPFSVSTVLSMIYMGARGNTEQEMEKVLHLRAIKDGVHIAYNEYIRLLQTKNDNFTLSTANRVYFHEKARLLELFRSKCLEFYTAEPFAVDFGANAEIIRQGINKWVEDQTNSKIKNLIAEGVLNAMTRMVIVNAIYFKGDWESKFNPNFTKKMPFHVTPSQSVDLDMMMKKKNFKHGVMKDLGFRFLELPYKGNDLSMIILLPDKKDGLSAIEKALTPDILRKIPKSFGYPEEIKVIFPKFRISTSFDLEKTLSLIGMKDLFIAGKANLSAIDELNSIHVSKVVHKAFVEVNEEGTEAAAATAAIMMLSAMHTKPKEFIVDHPFMFFIHDNRSGSILFLGRLTKPDDSSASNKKEEL